MEGFYEKTDRASSQPKAIMFTTLSLYVLQRFGCKLRVFLIIESLYHAVLKFRRLLFKKSNKIPPLYKDYNYHKKNMSLL